MTWLLKKSQSSISHCFFWQCRSVCDWTAHILRSGNNNLVAGSRALHKGLWIIGNPDGRAWASRRRRLPQKMGTKHTRSNVNGAHFRLSTDVVFVCVSVCVSVCVCACVCVFRASFLLLSLLIVLHLSPPVSWVEDEREGEQHVLKLWRRSSGINQQTMYGRKRPDVVSNIHRTLTRNWLPVVSSGEQLPKQQWGSSERVTEWLVAAK